MIDTLKEIAQERLNRRNRRKEEDKLRRQEDMLDPAKYEESMDLLEILRKKRDEDE
jgi:hypothetical protein